MTMTDNTAVIDKGFGWIPSRPDPRDFKFSLCEPVAAAPLPPSVDLSGYLGPVLDQGRLGSCVANACSGALSALQKRQFGGEWPLSRLLLYYEGRKIENTIQSDSGLMVRDAFKVLSKVGAAHENLHPYDIAKFTKKPPAKAYTDARKHTAIRYEAVNVDPTSVRQAIAGGFVVVVGFSVLASFVTQQVAQTGVMPMPQPGEQVLGGHCVYLFGYDDGRQAFICRNSWSADWGMGGNFVMPYQFVSPQYMGDFWILTQESG
jgi:C1A family cysteine protease